MSVITLENILANRSLLQSVSTEWLEEKLRNEPFNNKLRELVAEKKSNSNAHSASMIDQIILDQAPKSNSVHYIRDIVLKDSSVDASAKVAPVAPVQASQIKVKASPSIEAKTSTSPEAKAIRITGAAIGAGAAMVGSIPSLAVKTSKTIKMDTTEIVSNTSSMEKSGLLGFLNRIERKYVQKDLEFERSEGSSAAVDPMHKVMDAIKVDASSEKKLEIIEENEPTAVLKAKKVKKASSYGEELESKAELEAEDEKEKQKDIVQIIEESPEQMIFHEKVKKKKLKKKKKKSSGFKQEFRWLSYTPSDYDQTDLDPYTVWINTIDDTRLTKVKKDVKKDKKKKKKEKKYADSLESSTEIISEPLADLLASQGHFMQSIDMYERLSLKNPEKSSFFAVKIEDIKSKNRS